MDRMIYTAMSGAQQSFNQQAVVSNNLANVSTDGFRGQLYAMRAVPVQGAGPLATRVSVMATTPGSDFTPGPVRATGRNLDVALQGQAWLAVRAPDGQEAYTRRGDLQIDSAGEITSGGQPVLGANGPIIVPEGSTLTIGADGTVSAIGAGEQPNAIVQVGQLKMVTPTNTRDFVRGSDGLFQQLNAAGVPQVLQQDQDARLQTGALEGSNVNAVSSMVNMIATSRMYEMQMKVISTTDDNAQKANQLLSA